MPLKVPIRTHRAAIQGQEANARASVALAPLTCPSLPRDSQQGGEPAKPEDGGQWRVRPGLTSRPVPANGTPPAPGFRRGISHHGAPHESPVCIRARSVRGHFRLAGCFCMGLCENPSILPRSAYCDVFSIPQFQNGVESCPAQVF